MDTVGFGIIIWDVENSSSVIKVELGVDSGGDGRIDINGVQVIGKRGTDPGASPTTEQLRQVLLAHGLI